MPLALLYLITVSVGKFHQCEQTPLSRLRRQLPSMGARILSHIHKSKRIPQSASPPAPFDKGALSLSNIHQFDPERSKPFPTNSQTRCEILLHFPLSTLRRRRTEPLAATTKIIIYSFFFILSSLRWRSRPSPLSTLNRKNLVFSIVIPLSLSYNNRV